MIKILIAEDSMTVTMILQKIFASEEEFQVIGTARNGKEAVEKVRLLRPDIVTMDIRMPVMDGFEATKQIMTICPTPILVISASVGKDDLNIAFNAIRAGALDIVEKPKGNLAMDYEYIGRDLIKKIKILSGVKVFHHVSSVTTRGTEKKPLEPSPGKQSARSSMTDTREFSKADLIKFDRSLYTRILRPIRPIELVAVASSTGGPSALLKILKNLPPNFSVPVAIVQHICDGFGQGFVDWLNKECPITVKTAERGETMTAGNVYIAPDGYHMLVDPGKVVRLSKSMPINGLRPCATLMMDSAAKSLGSSVMGVILTGMGRDGADGMKTIKEHGGLTLAQNQESCVVFGMPKEAIELGVVDKVVSIDKMAEELLQVIKVEKLENA
ncbi:chemotaxis-specific protein-glutamate methyltransferase CheB [bacterium]|nr:chemotaxis-specific protein-glutamate methyltransferase CheB [bacterium]